MDFKDVIDKRRAVDFFDPEKVSNDLIRKFVEIAAKVPSSFNLNRGGGQRPLKR